MNMPQPNADTDFQRVAVRLQQRLAEKVANYEGELALVHEQYESQIEILKAQLAEAQSNASVPPSKGK